MSDQLQVSMQELAQMALGTSSLATENIVILHNLIDLLLKKLNCAEETVSIGGVESKCLQDILKQTKASTLPFNDQDIELIDEQLDRITKLEERIKSVSAKLDKHYEQIRINANADNKKFLPVFWEQYVLYCEDLCTACGPENEISCNLLKSPDFMRKLRQLVRPLVERVIQFENEIEELYKKFIKFSKNTEEQYEKLKLIGRIIKEKDLLVKLAKKHQVEFEETMTEVNAMLFAKMEKQHLPVIKKSLFRRFDEMETLVKNFGQEVGAQRLKKEQKVKIEMDKCLSCGRIYKDKEKVCDEKSNEVTKEAEPKDKQKTHGLSNIFCGCDGYQCMSRKRNDPQVIKLNLAATHSKQLMDVSHHILKKNVVIMGKRLTQELTKERNQ